MLAATGHALMMSFAMTWEILWALILGFGLSAIIQGNRVQRGDEALKHGKNMRHG